jgi:hypothetical protein
VIRKQASDTMVTVEFVLPGNLEHTPISVVGNFNDWQPYRNPMISRPDGSLSTSVVCPPGTVLRFRYLGNNGVWFDEHDADWIDGDGSVLVV